MTADGRLAPLSATQVLAALEVRVATGEVLRDRPVPLGFPTLDRAIGGGLRPGELLLLGGAQGTGKTTLALQMARNVAASGQATALYVCFEHDEEYLLHRLLAAETHLAGSGEPTAGVRLTDVRKEVAAAAGAAGAPGAVAASLVGNPRLAPAIERIAAYGPRLFLLRGSPADTVVAQLDALVRDYRAANPDGRLVLFLDYLQKVPVLPEPPGEAEKVTRIVNGLKDIALGNGVPLVSIVAADKEGLKASRLRHHHLRGSSALEYEADVILILNEKYSIVSRTAIEFNPHQAQRFHDQVIVTIEKNRAGQHRIDLELEKRFAYSCFAPDARPVAEKLIEERLYNE